MSSIRLSHTGQMKTYGCRKLIYLEVLLSFRLQLDSITQRRVKTHSHQKKKISFQMLNCLNIAKIFSSSRKLVSKHTVKTFFKLKCFFLPIQFFFELPIQFHYIRINDHIKWSDSLSYWWIDYLLGSFSGRKFDCIGSC